SQNSSNYSPHADSQNAGVIGASGAFAMNSSHTQALTAIGSNATIAATGVVEISSENEFAEFAGGGNPADGKLNVSAASGGGITAAAASSTSDLTGNSTVNIGDNVSISASSTPLANAASIGIDAASRLTT